MICEREGLFICFTDHILSLDSCPGEWIKGTDVKLKPKHVPITELNSMQLNRLLPPIYAYRPRGHRRRKRLIVSPPSLGNT